MIAGNVRHHLLIVLVIFILLGCTPIQKESSDVQLQTETEEINSTLEILSHTPKPSITPTQSPTLITQNTAFPKFVSLSDINLEDMLILPGDLPAGYSGAQIRNTILGRFSKFPESDNYISQQLQKNDEEKGIVIIWLYENLDNRQKALEMIMDDFGENATPLQGIGEQAIVSTREFDFGKLGKVQSVSMAFVRCNSIVYIDLLDTADKEDAESYAKRLDNRLNTAICNSYYSPPPTITPIFTETPLPRIGISTSKIISELELSKNGYVFETPRIIKGLDSYICKDKANTIIIELLSLDDNLAEVFMMVDLAKNSTELTNDVISDMKLLLDSILPSWEESSSWLEISISDAKNSGKVTTQQGDVRIELEIDPEFGVATLLITTNKE